MIRGLLIVSWAVANEAYRLAACRWSGHTQIEWVAGVCRCRCGKVIT